jgi:hypothetical protein
VDDEQRIRHTYRVLRPNLNERTKRLFAAAEARNLGRGGITIVERATGIERHVITRGLKELKDKKSYQNSDVIRKKGGGRKRNTTKDKTLEDNLKELIEPATKGNPMRLLLYVSKSLRHLSDALQKEGHKASHTLVRQILEKNDYRMQGNKKDNEGWSHPDRNAQFEYIDGTAKRFINVGEPVISIDTKKKELVGDFKNNGREWRPKGTPEIVKVHDFPDKTLGKVAPYGVYDLARDEGMVNVGIDHDTAQFAVESIRQWWRHLGKKRYTKAKRIYITADAGGSNGYRIRLWKVELQKLANETGLKINVSHFPPGLSKWNKIEHRLFSYISENWRATPLRDHATIINLIASTTNKTGLKVYARLDTRKYVTKVKVSDEEFNLVNIRRADFHGEWNYTILPRKTI